MKKILYIKFSHLFDKLSAAAMTKIADIAALKQYEKGQIVCLENDEVHGLFIVGRGALKVYKISDNGQIYIMKLATDGMAIGEVAALLENICYPANVQAVEDSELLYIPRTDFINLLKKEPEISFNLLAGFAKIIYEFTNKVGALALTNVKDRLLKFIFEKAAEQGKNEIELDISKQTLAELIGTIPETVSRVLKSLENEKVIKVSGKKIIILNENQDEQ